VYAAEEMSAARYVGKRPLADIQTCDHPASMDRRSLLGLVAAFATTPAAARSFALKSPRSSGMENQQVQRLFEAWWQRDEVQFRAIFVNRLMDDGSPMSRDIADELDRLNPLPANTFDIFSEMFLDERKTQKLVLLVNTNGGIFAACSERNFKVDPNAETDPPDLHLFLIKMLGLNARSVRHLTTVATPEPGKFDIWSAN